MIISAATSTEEKSKFNEHETSNSFYHKLTHEAKTKLQEGSHIVNPVIESLDPETFEVAAKKKSLMWSTQQYRDEDHRKALN